MSLNFIQCSQRFSIALLLLMCALVGNSAALAEESREESYRRWTYHFDGFQNAHGLETNVTYLSRDLLLTWVKDAPTRDTRARAEAILKKAQEDGLLLYMVELKSNGGWLKFADPKENITLYSLEAPAGVKPISAPMNLARRIEGKQRAFGLVVFKTNAQVGPQQSLILDIQYGGALYITMERGETGKMTENRFDALNRRAEAGDLVQSVHISFLPYGVPEDNRIERATSAEDMVGTIQTAFDILSMLTFKVPFKIPLKIRL